MDEIRNRLQKLTEKVNTQFPVTSLGAYVLGNVEKELDFIIETPEPFPDDDMEPEREVPGVKI